MKKRIIAIILCLSTLLSIAPVGNVVANNTVSAEDDVAVSNDAGNNQYTNYGAVIGNIAEFNYYFPVPITDIPQNVKNPWGTDCEYISEDEVTENILMVVTNYYCADDGSLWYKVDAAPGYQLPQKLSDYPWIYQDNVKMPLGESLIIHSGGKNFVFDKNGDVVTSAQIGLYDSVELECRSSLIGRTEYQWQILIGGEWVDIAEKRTSAIDVDFALMASAVNSERQSKLRCVSKSGSKSVIGDPITVNVNTDDPETPMRSATFVRPYANVSTLAEGIDVCYVTVQFLFENGTQAANSFVAEVPIGLESTVAVDFPYVQGYVPYYEGVQQDQLTLSGVFYENEIYVVYYEPTYVDYTVDIYFQNIENDDYSFYDSRTYQGLTGSKVPLNTQAFVGMHELLHETPTIAADGSTHVEVYYNRIYYMTRVYLAGGFGIYSVYARYGANLQSHLTAPTRPGYSFIGWDEYTVDSNDDGVPDTGGNDIADTVHPVVPAKNLAYVALWKENATSQVNVVFWGENPNDEGYSYLSTEQLQVKPGTELTYALNGAYVCGLESHTHGNGCTTNCGIDEHTHSASCYILSCDKEHVHTDDCYTNCTGKTHTHTTNCYTVSYPTYGNNFSNATLSGVNNQNTVSNLNNQTPWSNGIVRSGNYFWDYKYYIKLDDKWYQLEGNYLYNINYDTNITVNRTNQCHVHTNDCLGCGKDTHTHTNYSGSCYTLTCTKMAHTHVGTCYDCVEHTHSQATCGYPRFDGYNANLWELVKTDTVTVERDGSTVLNVYFDRKTFTLTFKATGSNGATLATITTKWGTDIRERFQEICSDNTFLWSRNTNGNSPWTSFLDVMPKENRTYYAYISNTGTTQTAQYWGQDSEGNYTLLLFESSVKYNGNLTVSEEEFVDIEGFTFNESKSSKEGAAFNNATFYYDRAENLIEFYSGNNTVKTETVQYEFPLNIYRDFIPPLPSEYEENSHEFMGWYLNPECTGDEVDLDTAKMPAGNLALYAKWVPRYHTVRVVLQKKDDGIYGPEDSVLIVGDDKVESISVLHGTIVFSGNDDKTPPVPENGQYKFLGWFYMDDDVELMWDFEHHPVVRDTVIYAKWSSEVMVPYTIYYKDTSGNEIAPPLVSSSLAGHSLTVKAKVGNELNAEYRNKYFPQSVSHSIALDIDKADTGVEYTFVYEKAENKKYYVHYVDADNGNAELDGSPVEKSSEYAIVTETYKYYDGFVPDAYQKSHILSSDESQNHIYFYYTKANDKGVWFVGHYVENKDVLGQYDTHSTSGDVAEIGKVITATWQADLTNDGFEFSHATISGDGETKTVYSLDQAKGNVTQKGLAINVYYKRIKYPYKVVYRNKDTGLEIRESDIFKDDSNMQPYGKTVTLDVLPTIEGYEYASSGSCTIVKDDPTNITKNVIYVYYTEQTIRIDFKVVGPDGCGTVNPESLFVKYVSDKSATVEAEAAANFRFVGWYYDESCTNPIVNTEQLKPNGNMMILQKHDGWAPATYYAKFELMVSDLTIIRSNASDSSQVYVYEVRNSSTGETIYVTIVGNGKVTIKNLRMGEYTVTQQNDWSWRYNDVAQTVDHQSMDGTTIEFNGESSKNQWLNGNSDCVKNQRGNQDE